MFQVIKEIQHHVLYWIDSRVNEDFLVLMVCLGYQVFLA
jgi:hypothetical protein